MVVSRQPVDIEQILLLAVRAALSAARPILEVYASDFEVWEKRDRSPVTEADLIADREIRAKLGEDRAGRNAMFPVVSEESEEMPYDIRRTWDRLWLVDPLDGTKEFVGRNGEFTTNIALVEGGQAVAGVVYAPLHRLLYFGSITTGSYRFAVQYPDAFYLTLESFGDLIQGAQRLPLQTAACGETGNKKGDVIIAVSRSHRMDGLEEFLSHVREKHGAVSVVARGSALKLCMVAEGTADLYPRFGRTMEWDTAAGHALISGTGKRVVDCDRGKDLCYNKRDLFNPSFIAGEC